MKLLIDLLNFLIPDEEIDHPKKKVKSCDVTRSTTPKKPQPKKTVVVQSPNFTSKKTKSKKDEIIEALAYMKSKKGKTKKDKESIYILEMVLKNMK